MEENREQLYTQLTPLQGRLKHEEEERNKQLASTKEKEKTKYFISSLSGVIVGALLMWILTPSLANPLPSSTVGIEQTATLITTDVTNAVEKVSEAVVGISNYQVIQNSLSNSFGIIPGIFSDTQQKEQEQGELQEAGTGSGVIYKIKNNEAYIVTNHHVIENAEMLEVTLADGSKKKAKLIGSDIWTDLAVIKVDASNIKTVANFGDSEVLKQGETVIAIGNPLSLDFYGSVTVGVISGKNRFIPIDLNGDKKEDWQSEVLQTDAAINGGNSGGALVNLNGDLIGINSLKIASAKIEGLGFAIPINIVIPIIQQLEENGRVIRPEMGISLINLTDVPAFHQVQTLQLLEDVTTGVVISEVVDGSAADEAGMKQYDVIFEMDGQTIENIVDLRQHLYTKTKVGDTLNVKVYRGGDIVKFNLLLKESST